MLFRCCFIFCLVAARCLGDLDGPAIYQVTEPVDHAECPTWDGRKNVLYYVDIHVGRIICYDYYSKNITSISLAGEIAPVIPSSANPNLLIVGLNRSVVAVEWDGESTSFAQQLVVNLAADKPTSRMNEGKADKQGRLWFGTMGFQDPNGILTPDDGILYKIPKAPYTLIHPEPMIRPVNISNGLAWNKANDKFYYIDSPSLQIAEYDYNDANGTISNRRVAFDLMWYDMNFHPDGMTIDIDDNLWVALYGGGSVIQVNPKTGELLRRIAVPAESVTSVMWGGPDLDILFVTTSRYSLTEDQKKRQPAAGSLFAITDLGTKGLPVFEADII